MTFSLSISRSGDRTLLVRRADGRTVHIHSSYDPQWEAERTVEQLPADGRRGYIVCGAGLGYHIRRLLEVCPPQSLVFVIEPTARDSFRPLICQVFAADRWWQDRRLVWLVGPGLRELASIINKRAQTDGIRQLTLLQYFPVVCLYREFYDRFTASVFAKTEELMNLDYDYRRKAQIETFVNAWDNLPAIAAAPPIDGWRGRAAGRRAVVVGGGPSLDLDIEQLAASRDQFLVIAAGSAIGALHRAGIAPDFLVVVDPFAVNVGEVSQFLSDEVVLVVPYTAPRRLVAGHGGMTLFFRTPETSPAANVLDCVADNLPPAAELMASASVVVTAVDWALFLGCSDIALLGVDMAFPDGKSHATGVMAADYPTAGGQDGREAITVEGWQGEKIPSSTVFRELLHFFAEWFTIFSVKVVNCSRLGAKIDGIDNIRFEQWLAAIGAGDRLPR
ncbi:MAG: DUF115 domain-containing protein, partial [Negativicutes bacterium]|nr:DUF115 domain-containing protein [Negativicutes bacterium]